MTSRLQKLSAMTIAVLLVLLAIPLGATARGLHLDPGFGQGGMVLSNKAPNDGFVEEGTGIRLAEGIDGRLVVGARGIVRQYLPSGKPDSGFGDDGQIEVERPGNTGFSLSDVAVDRRGRVLVAGTTLHFPPQGPIGVPPVPGTTIGRATATILRYLPDGSLDPTFGNDGVVETSFDLPAPIDRISGQPFEEPVTRITDLAIDSQGRLLVFANSALEYNACGDIKSGLQETVGGFVARLTPDGKPDPTFGEATGPSAGVVSIGEHNAGRWLGVAPGDEPVFYSPGGGCGTLPVVLGRLDSAGRFDRGFGANGWRRLPLGSHAEKGWRARAIGLDGAGRMFVLGSSRAGSMPIEKLLGSGRRDPAFGRDGRVSVSLPGQSRLAGLIPDERGGVWAFGSMRSDRLGKGSPRSSFLLTGLDRAGRLRHDLHGSRATTQLPRKDVFRSLSGLVDRRGRVVIAAEISSPRGWVFGVALARYVP